MYVGEGPQPGRLVSQTVESIITMEQLITAHMTSVLKDEDRAAEPGTKEETFKVAKSMKYKVLMLIVVAVLFCIQFFRELLTSESLVNQVFHLANNYINASRPIDCSCATKVEI